MRRYCGRQTRAADAVFRRRGATRRALLERLRDGGRSASELGAGFKVSQPPLSISRVLREVRLLTPPADSRRRLYRVNPQKLAQGVRLAEHYSQFWDERLAGLGRHLDREVAVEEVGRSRGAGAASR